jgi:hypothetical protein
MSASARLDEFLSLVKRRGGRFKLFLRAHRLGLDPILFALEKVRGIASA